MKKYFSFIVAVATMFAVTSCSQEEVIGNENNDADYASASFTINTPEGMNSRAIGDGTTVNKVACAVYDENGDEMTNLRQYVDINNKQATYNVRLAKGQNYRVAFFAYNEGAAAYDVTNLKSIKILPNQASNIEGRDAFTNYTNINAADLTNQNNYQETVTLKRPFAQLNLGIDNTEYQDAANAGVVVTNSQITVTNVYDAFNAFDNDVADDAKLGSMTFAMNGVPQENLIVNGQAYTYLALNYLLVGDKGDEKALADVDFMWQTADGKTNNPTTHFINIPVQRNYRTNIIGKLLTTPAEFTIIIDEKFDGEYTNNVETVITKSVSTAAALQEAIDNAPEGQTRIVLGDIINGDIVVKQKRDVQILIDGQDKIFNGTITVEGASNWGGTEGFSIQNTQFMTVATGDFAFIRAGYNDATRYAHNIIITECAFTLMNPYNPDTKVVGIKAYQPNDVIVNDCKFNKLHSVAQITGGSNITFEKVVASSCVRGISLGTANNSLVSNCKIEAKGDGKYGVRQDAAYADSGLKIVNSTINASFPVVVRLNQSSTVNSYTLSFEGDNTLTPATDAYHVAIAKEEYDNVGESLTPLCGNVTITGAGAWNIFK